MGGEHHVATRHTDGMTGSPPHGRGTQVGHGVPPGGSRLTPAWAGNTTNTGNGTNPTTAHPRMGGEHWSHQRRARSSVGSPPHGRGTLEHGALDVEHVGLTPAWAGNTPGPRSRSHEGRAHPRMGGEHPDVHVMGIWEIGSPPHGRGTRCHQPRRGLLPGLTPAWAGNTSYSTTSRTPARAHPRMGGEHPIRGRHSTSNRGSPPHGRGTLARSCWSWCGPGLTPAWAGNTRCGRSGRASEAGSPPHGRGTPQRGPPESTPLGLTPAWAGNTAAPAARCRCPRAHPRMGGEHTTEGLWAEFALGSPPHGRGTLSVTCWFRRMMTECPVLMDCQDARQAARPTGVRPGR